MAIVSILLTALFISTSPATAEKPHYRWLTTGELENLLRGNRITQPDKPAYQRTPEEFHKNGWHVLYADNYEAHGKYTFRNDSVCDQELGHKEICRKILIDDQGRYWIVSRTNSRLLNRISIQPLR